MANNSRRVSAPIKSWLFIALFLVSGLLFSLWLFLFLNERHHRQVTLEFNNLASQRMQVLDNHVQRSLEVLFGLSAFLHWPHNREFSVFREYVRGSLERLPEVQALEWIPIVSDGERPEYESRARAQGLADFKIMEFDGRGELRKAAPRAHYYPVYFAYPQDANVEAIGLDLASQPDRKRAIEASLASGKIVATAPVRLAQEKVEAVYGILIFAPVPAAQLDGSAAAPATEGFALVVYRSIDLLAAVFSGLADQGVQVSVADSERENITLYANHGKAEHGGKVEHRAHTQGQRARVVHDYTLGERLWRVSFTPSAAYLAGSKQLSVLAYPAISALLVLTFGLYAGMRNRYLFEVERQVQARTLALKQEADNRREAEAQAQQAEKMYRSMFENAIDGIFQTTREGVYLNANTALARIYGYETREAFINSLKNIETQLYVDPSRRGQFVELMQRDGQVSDFVSQVYRADGSRIFILEKAISVFDENDRFLYYEGNVQDITSHIEAQQALEQANEWLEERVSLRTQELAQANRELREEVRIREAAEREAAAANAAKTQFLAGVSHEIRTPLNAIIGYSQILQQQADLQDRQQLAIKTIAQSGNHLLNLIDDILDLSKIEVGLVQVSAHDFDLSSLINNIAYLVRRKCEDKGLALKVEGLGHNPVWVRGDEGKLRQVLINLLSNAVKYTGNGEVILRVVPESGDQYRFEVIDTGPGIPEKDLARIFDQFFQRASWQEGTGLGLSIASRIAQAIGTAIQVRSTPGIGSNFFFHLNFEQAQELHDAPQELLGTATRLQPGERCLVLVVDDIQHNRDILQQMLETFGCDVLTAASGAKALEFIALQEPSIIFMDILMPGMDGIATRAEMLARFPNLRSVFVAFSASAFDEQRRQYLTAGFAGVISKPFRIEQLQLCLQQHLNLRFEPEAPVQIERAEPAFFLSASDAEPLLEAARVYNVTQLKRLLNELTCKFSTHAEQIQQWRQLAEQHNLEALIHELQKQAEHHRRQAGQT